MRSCDEEGDSNWKGLVIKRLGEYKLTKEWKGVWVSKIRSQHCKQGRIFRRKVEGVRQGS